MGVKLDDVRSRDDGILFQQYPFGFGGEGTVGLAEDNYYVSQVNKYDLSSFGAQYGLRRTGPLFQDRVQLHLYFMILFALDLLFFLHLLSRWVFFLLSVYDHRSLFP